MQDSPITVEEIKGAVKEMTKGKATGGDGLPLEFFEHYSGILFPELLKVYL